MKLNEGQEGSRENQESQDPIMNAGANVSDRKWVPQSNAEYQQGLQEHLEAETFDGSLGPLGSVVSHGVTERQEPEVYNPRPGTVERKAWLASSEESQAFKAMKEASGSRETEAEQTTGSAEGYPIGPFEEMAKALEKSD